MKKLAVAVLAALLVMGCSKEQELQELDLRINISDFSITSDDFGSLKSTGTDMFSDFHHVFDGGTLYFKSEDGSEFKFSSGDHSLNGAVITLAPGKYTVYGMSHGMPSPSGSMEMQYEVPGQDVYIYYDSELIELMVEPVCALALVSDMYELLSMAYFEHDHMDAYWSLYEQNMYHYAYFLPEEYYSIKLKRHTGAEFSLYTKDLNYGYIYKILVQEQDTMSQTIDLDPWFEEWETIVW